MLDAAAAAALLAPLRPWLRVLTYDGSTCELKSPARTERGVVFTFKTSFYATENASAKLRQAIDLGYRVLSLHTALALHFDEEGVEYLPFHMRGISDPSVKRQLVRDAPFEMKIIIATRQLEDAAVLKRWIADEVVTDLSQTESTDPSYLAAKAQLDAVLDEKKPGWKEALVRQPIAASFHILDRARNFQMASAQAKVFFEQFTAFVDVLNRYKVPLVGSLGHLPMSFEIGILQIVYMPITRDVATALTPILSMENVNIRSTHVTINPRLIICSREELDVFLHAIQATVVEVFPRRLTLEMMRSMRLIDRGIDSGGLIRMLLASISDCKSVQSIRCGVLFNFYGHRPEIAEALVYSVMARAQPLNLVLNRSQNHVLDARALTHHAQKWKTENPNGKLRLKKLVFAMYDEASALARAFIRALNEVEELSINKPDVDEPSLTSQEVAGILERFTTLRKLCFCQLDLETMRVFSTKAPPTLESLSLSEIRLADRHSFLEFVQELGNPQQGLFQHLRHLSISEFLLQNIPYKCELLNDQELGSLASTLRSNRVLDDVRVVLTQDHLIRSINWKYTLRSAAGSVVPAPPNVRRSSEEKARRVAFLSVVLAKPRNDLNARTFDTFIVCRIFEFSDPCVLRWISMKSRNEWY